MYAAAVLDSRGEDAAPVRLAPTLDRQQARETRGLAPGYAHPAHEVEVAAQHLEALVRPLGAAPRHADAVLQVLADPAVSADRRILSIRQPLG